VVSATTRLIDVRDVLRLAASHSPEGHPHIGSEHVALAALDGPRGLRSIATDAGLDPDRITPALLGCCTDQIERSLDHPEITPRTAVMAALAAQAAWADGAPKIGSEHLLRALLEEPGAIAWAGLRAAGLTPAIIFDALVRDRDRPWPNPSRDVLPSLLAASHSALVAWQGYTMLAEREGSADYRDAIGAARSMVRDMAALGLRLGVLDSAEVEDMSSVDPARASAAYSRAARRIGDPRLEGAPASPQAGERIAASS